MHTLLLFAPVLSRKACGDMEVSNIVKVFYILLLSLAFIFLIALPILKKFEERGVFIEESQFSEEDALEPPALTFCARNERDCSLA